MKKMKAYTLAEVLIALGIIGVIAAVMVPTISSLRPDPIKAMYLRNANALAKAVQDISKNSKLYPASYSDGSRFYDVSNYPLFNDDPDNPKFGEHLCNALGGDICGTGTTHFNTNEGTQWIVTTNIDTANFTYRSGVLMILPNDDHNYSFVIKADGSVIANDNQGQTYLANRKSLLKNSNINEPVIAGNINNNSVPLSEIIAYAQLDNQGNNQGNSGVPQAAPPALMGHGSSSNADAGSGSSSSSGSNSGTGSSSSSGSGSSLGSGSSSGSGSGSGSSSGTNTGSGSNSGSNSCANPSNMFVRVTCSVITGSSGNGGSGNSGSGSSSGSGSGSGSSSGSGSGAGAGANIGTNTGSNNSSGSSNCTSYQGLSYFACVGSNAIMGYNGYSYHTDSNSDSSNGDPCQYIFSDACISNMGQELAHPGSVNGNSGSSSNSGSGSSASTGAGSGNSYHGISFLKQ